MDKTVEEFQQAVKDRNIDKWHIHDCSMCGYDCGYIFKDNKVYYDSGCHCTGRYVVEPRTWDNVVEQYNMQSNDKVISAMDKFWGV